MASLDVDPDVEDAWAAEVERRHQEVESGAVTMLPGPETLAKLKSEFR
ncbi:MAG: addiction module protein [Thermoanaerobaculia bacterium]